ncbi:MAG: hypothetical protein LBV41_00915, partial [Cytophagaceae bacterium]|nr:hypothetical protein [Cytophagaceae bacterium]
LNFALQLASSGNSLKKSINVIISNFYAKIIILGKYTGSHFNLFKEQIKNLVIDIANKNYTKIELEKINGRVNIIDLERVIDEYNRTIIPLPDSFEIDMNKVYHIKKENNLFVLIDLWTKEEGRSDLTLSLTCFLENNEPMIRIDDLEVL